MSHLILILIYISIILTIFVDGAMLNPPLWLSNLSHGLCYLVFLLTALLFVGMVAEHNSISKSVDRLLLSKTSRKKTFWHGFTSGMFLITGIAPLLAGWTLYGLVNSLLAFSVVCLSYSIPDVAYKRLEEILMKSSDEV
jgi:hypothetical protein